MPRTMHIGVEPCTGVPAAIASRQRGSERRWLHGPIAFSVGRVGDDLPGVVTAAHEIKCDADRAVWTMTLSGSAPRVEHEIAIDLPVLFPGARIFTPSQYGVMDVDAYPTFTPRPYGSYDWNEGQAYVLPLVSVMDPETDQALTVALPADDNIPHLQIDWIDGRILRLRMGRRGVGEEEPIQLRVLLYAHAADYRAALRAYTDDYPAWFRPVLPRGESEGTFWYHHIHDHPDFDEMARQQVRYHWASFWFPWLGEFLPAEREWYPYTYARWWRLQRRVGDETIRTHVRKLREHGIGTFAYFNVTEYGGAGGEHGTAEEADRIVEGPLAPALVRSPDGGIITTWEGSKVINPGRGLPFWPILGEQARRHLDRLPGLEGFLVDRLDWASRFDYGANDGLSMVGNRPVTNLAVSVGEAVRELCRLAHAADRRVFVNQFWRVEILRDTDGYCHENDYLPAMGYLAPFRPASAWHQREDYTGDLLAFEAQMKRRLHWALFPQMIAHEFPISQQRPDVRAADLMELYAPLFAPLRSKEQVLLPHCVQVSGPNDANLFRNAAGHYVAPLSSRVCFLTRSPRSLAPVTLTVRVPDASALAWAHVVSLDGPPYRAVVTPGADAAVVQITAHGSSSVVVIGAGPEPALVTESATRAAELRAQWFASAAPRTGASTRPRVANVQALELEIRGESVGVSRPAGVVDVHVDGEKVGEIHVSDSGLAFDVPTGTLPEYPSAVRLLPRDEGSWFVPESVQWVARMRDGRRVRVASWVTGDACAAAGERGLQVIPSWCEPIALPTVTAHFEGQDLGTGGAWPGTLGGHGMWTPGRPEITSPSGYVLRVGEGSVFVWADEVRDDPRVVHALEDPDAPRQAACWYDEQAVTMRVVPPDEAPYRLTLYLLDYDRASRHQRVALRRGFTVLDEREVSPGALARGAHLTWTVTGPVDVSIDNLHGANAVVSAVFVDS